MCVCVCVCVLQEEQLISVVHGLLRQGKLHFLTALREKLQSFLKEKTKETVSSYMCLRVPCTEGDADEAPSLADRMRGLEFVPWLAMMEHVFDKVTLYLKAVQVHQSSFFSLNYLICLNCSFLQGSLKVIAGVCEMAAGKAPPIAPPTVVTELEEDASDNFQVTFTAPLSSTVGDIQPPQMMKSRVGEEEMESFEADLLAQETEDRLTQLMLDDELSDARLGLGVEPGVEPGVEQPFPHVASIPSFTSNMAMSQSGPLNRTYSQPNVHSRNTLLLETAKETLAASQEQLGHADSRTGSKSVVMTTHEELTLDVKEKERLEDSLIIAG